MIRLLGSLAAGLAIGSLFLAVLVVLSGCTSTGDYRRPISEGGTMIGPYDVTLTSHQEALGIRR